MEEGEDLQQQLTSGNFFSSEDENSWQMFEGNGEPWFGFFGSYEE